MSFENLETYQLLKEEVIRDLNSTAYIMRHKKSGARIFLLSNDDENKVFTIGFRTPPANSTGVAHILEHSVLCGSKKFPLKDPFVELVKGSLNTFLNAMTYPDKTVYPVASCNDTDFQNLMDVYMDAVLNPRIYENDKIFRQEGWHYEMESPESPLTINGVVYNEMKGAFSSPDSVLERSIQNGLFPDNTYGNESGGDPDVIPQLSYEEFLAFHKKYYHPSNSYIYLYGNMDMEEKLRWLDEEYLSHYEEAPVDSEIHVQKPFSEPVIRTMSYSADEDGDEGSYLAMAMAVGSVLDRKQYVAMSILDYALLDAPGAPLKQALIDKKLCRDVYGGTESGILQPYFSVVAKGADPDRMQEFKDTVRAVLKELMEKGLNKRTLAAGMNSAEFKYREADFGSYPKGLMYGLQCFDSWLYDETDPLMHLSYSDTFDWLREHMEEGYFEGLIKDWLLDNPHQVQIIMNPEAGLSAKKDARLSEMLAARKASMTTDEIDRIVKETKELKAFQEASDPPEVLAKIPLLSREDIGKKVQGFCNDYKQEKGGDVVHHELFTGGIGYLQILFDMDGMNAEEIQYASLLKTLLCMVNTEHYTYGELADEIGMNCGGLSAGIGTFDDCRDFNRFTGVFELVSKVKTEKLDFVFDMFREIVFTSDLTDRKRIAEVIAQTSSRLQMRMISGGHMSAVGRAVSGFSRSARFSELTGGLEYARFINRLEASFENCSDEIVEKLCAVREKIFKPSRMVVSYTSDAEGYEKLPGLLEKFTCEFAEHFHDSAKPSSAFGKGGCRYDLETGCSPVPVKEGLVTSGQIQYVARAGSFASHGLEYRSTLRILGVILNYDYLWLNLRVKGGAYGCMSGFARNGESYLVSYRDPNLKETNDIYEGIPEYLRSFQADERDMTKYIIGTISDMDIPQTPKMKGARSMAAWMTGVTEEMLQEDRDRILSCQVEDIRELADYVEAVLESGNLCVVGSETKIRENKAMFDSVENMFPRAKTENNVQEMPQ
ncbi:MAG: insulinase family protein [Lachnospiraceae bacterium]|nr:insulinase family protein [Lachnospiraceae bacterium]